VFAERDELFPGLSLVGALREEETVQQLGAQYKVYGNLYKVTACPNLTFPT
jgi:hypothetical protein